MFAKTFAFWQRIVGKSAAAQKTTNEDRRLWARYPTDLQGNVQIGHPVSDAQPVKVLDISASGIGLIVGPSLQTGSLLTVDLLDKTGRKACTILACIVHATQRSDGNLAVGCNFIRELTEEELQTL